MDKHPEALTRAIELTTNVPFPTSGHELSAECLDDQKIALTICSELLQYTAPISTFDGQGKLGLITDLNGQPIVFSVGTDHVSQPPSKIATTRIDIVIEIIYAL